MQLYYFYQTEWTLKSTKRLPKNLHSLRINPEIEFIPKPPKSLLIVTYSIPICLMQRIGSRADVVAVVYRISIIYRQYHRSFMLHILLLNCPKHNLIGFLVALLIVSMWGRGLIPMMILLFLLLLMMLLLLLLMMLLLLLLLLNISIPPTIDRTTLPPLMHLFCILWHEWIGFPRRWGSGFSRRRLVFIWYHKAVLHRPRSWLLLVVLILIAWWLLSETGNYASQNFCNRCPSVDEKLAKGSE